MRNILGSADIESRADTIFETLSPTSSHVAARCGNAEVVRVLVKCGTNVNATSGDGSTALPIAQMI